MKKHSSKIILMTSLLILMFMTISSAASVSILSWWLNGKDGQLKYYTASKYSESVHYASGKFNSKKNAITSRIYDSGIANVRVFDYSEINSIYGEATPTGSIRLNTYKMNNASITRRNHVLMHEMGHALGLGHNTGSKDVMWQGGVNDVIVLSTNDIASLEASASRYGR